MYWQRSVLVSIKACWYAVRCWGIGFDSKSHLGRCHSSLYQLFWKCHTDPGLSQESQFACSKRRLQKPGWAFRSKAWCCLVLSYLQGTTKLQYDLQGSPEMSYFRELLPSILYNCHFYIRTVTWKGVQGTETKPCSTLWGRFTSYREGTAVLLVLLVANKLTSLGFQPGPAIQRFTNCCS